MFLLDSTPTKRRLLVMQVGYNSQSEYILYQSQYQ